MPMTKEDAWNELIIRLKAVAGVLKVYEGWVELESVPHATYPCIVAEPVYSEVDEDFHDSEAVSYGNEIFAINLFLLFKIYEKDKQVTGTVGIAGALDWEKVIKEAICDVTLPNTVHLDGLAARVFFGRTDYLRFASEQPGQLQLRVVQMEVYIRQIICT